MNSGVAPDFGVGPAVYDLPDPSCPRDCPGSVRIPIKIGGITLPIKVKTCPMGGEIPN